MNPKKESDLESIASDRTLRNSGSVSSLDSYMTACEEFDYSLFPFLYRGIQNADRGENLLSEYKLWAIIESRNFNSSSHLFHLLGFDYSRCYS